ncbi:Rrf2 family transcriptional regulator [Ornithinibacillus sp. BX22]|uniref:Rrf2 family transcriptional regulator n=1 Tax=Ornithinibacillus hominis TaxID=2763055 RepID=A0A923L5C5_9BACI|nr:Rrf2 family transcriptional regulator [Ornithinibacillus hominis]MBC5636716.1 Rrf2 family transcriptional regulator [Ornithinibacillus hominis]
MSISSRFSVGIHILTLIEIDKDGVSSSEYIARSVNTNPAVIRKIMGMLKKAGLIKVQPGIAGAELARDLSDITLLDVYKAVNVVKDNELFSIHENPNPDCSVGRNIQNIIVPHFISAQTALEKTLENVTIENVVNDVKDNEKLNSKH